MKEYDNSDLRTADSTKDYFIPHYNKFLMRKNKYLKRKILQPSNSYGSGSDSHWDKPS